MYCPEPFSVKNENLIQSFIQKYPFATLVSPPVSYPVSYKEKSDAVFVSHIPVLLKSSLKNGILQGHFARQNSHWEVLKRSPQVKVIFHGPHAYISPNFYTSPGLVPTWNYAAVHVQGTAKVIEDSRWLNHFLERLTSINEGQGTEAWKFEPNSPSMKSLLPGIVGFEIRILEVEAKFKLSQNRSESDRNRVKQACLNSKDAQMRELGEWMK